MYVHTYVAMYVITECTYTMCCSLRLENIRVIQIADSHWSFSKQNWSFLNTCESIWPFFSLRINTACKMTAQFCKWPSTGYSIWPFVHVSNYILTIAQKPDTTIQYGSTV